MKTENIQPNQEESMPEQELPIQESTEKSTETSTSQKEEDKVGFSSYN